MKPQKSYFICMTPRSGSTLLSQALTNTGLAGKPDEHFYHRETPENPQGSIIPDYLAYIQKIQAETTTPNGVFGTKIGGGIWERFMERLRTIEGYSHKPAVSMIAEQFPNPHYIWLTRRNKVRQAVSHWRAIQSGRWHSPLAIQKNELEYKFEAIDHLVQELIIREAVWSEYFTFCKITPFVIVYEDFVLNYEATIKAVLAFLDIETEFELPIRSTNYQKLADTLSEEWVQRYRQEKQQDWWRVFWRG